MGECIHPVGHHFTEWREEKRLIKGQEDEFQPPQTPDSDVTPGW